MNFSFHIVLWKIFNSSYWINSKYIQSNEGYSLSSHFNKHLLSIYFLLRIISGTEHTKINKIWFISELSISLLLCNLALLQWIAIICYYIYFNLDANDICSVVFGFLNILRGHIYLGWKFHYAQPRASLVAQLVMNPSAMQETPVPFLGQEDPLEKGQAKHSSVLAFPWWFRW